MCFCVMMLLWTGVSTLVQPHPFSMKHFEALHKESIRLKGTNYEYVIKKIKNVEFISKINITVVSFHILKDIFLKTKIIQQKGPFCVL